MAEGKLKKYAFKGKIWKHKGASSWHFVTLPPKVSSIIRKAHGLSEEGWGRLKATASIGNCKWQTAIWFDTKAKSYLLPIKAEIRRKERAIEGSQVSVSLYLIQDQR